MFSFADGLSRCWGCGCFLGRILREIGSCLVLLSSLVNCVRGREEIGVWGVEKGFDHRTGLGIRVELGVRVGIGVRVWVGG